MPGARPIRAEVLCATVSSKFDGLSRKALVLLQEECRRQQRTITFRDRTFAERFFYVEHGCFPDDVGRVGRGSRIRCVAASMVSKLVQF